MRPTPTKRRFQPGFRISLSDIVFLIVLIVLTLFANNAHWYFAAIALLLPGLQFFLFCNVFRIRRKPELVWMAFYLIFVPVLYLYFPSLWLLAIIPPLFGLALIVNEFRYIGYHGVLWRWINPDLPEWFEDHSERK